MLQMNDNNFLAFTIAEANEIAEEFRAEYPNMRVLPVRSNVKETFFENHWKLIGVTGAIVLGSWFNHTRIGKKITRDFANLL
jgi:hypothetical protein